MLLFNYSVIQSRKFSSDASDFDNFPKKPKPPVSPFLRYVLEVQPEIRKICKSSDESRKKVVQLWKIADESKKQLFKEQYAIDKVINYNAMN